MSAAMGGKTLLSADARQSLSTDGLRLQSHGHWRIKGLDEPLELFEIGDDDAPFFPPPDGDKAYRVVRCGELWSPVREIRHSLRADGDAFVGRVDALAELSRRIQSGARLVSVLGIAAAARHAWRRATAGVGSASSPAASGSAIWRARAAPMASQAPWRRGSTFHWAGTIRWCRSATPSPDAVRAW